MIVAAISTGFSVVLFIVLGIVFSKGKGSILIAGYNTMTKEEQNKYDKVALCKFMGKMMYALSFCTTFWVISIVSEMMILLYIGITLFFVVIVFTLIYLNTGNRFKR